MSPIRHLLTLAAALALATPAAAQVDHDLSTWVNLTATGPIAGKLIYFAEVQPRVGRDAEDVEQLLLRPAIGVQATPNLQLYLGYAHVEEPAAGENEERLFQQATLFVRDLPGELQSRTRLEQRWRTDGRDMQWRLRQMLRYEYPVARKLAPMASVEAFVALNEPDWRPRSGFDQLRTFVGVELGLKGTSTIEAGYLNQIVDRAGPASRMNHVLSVSLFLRH
ncbi:DUF2490 domain-containing protein [Sphingomonas corticis]|uniref:DUF2490 domain-containing protein n=1 Tax=Sphingomonas corticis TaxID=2722791 RepID=A0ABX1CK44_9SPHN|nr:DUF2490 domain-containing protein [Sphingomonas corticis]NJR78372.1 DUF2490 domain-containing protein [Sphingomonas corticis]